MTDQYTTTLDPRDLSSRLTHIQHDQQEAHHQQQNANSIPTPNPTPRRRPRAPSLDSLPHFTKSSTISTTSSSGSDFSRLRSAAARSSTNRQSVEVLPGEFSKPRVHPRSQRRRERGLSTGSGSRRGSGNGSGAGEDFRYYGRHGNQWLFNDFSVTEAVRRGWGRVFRREDGGAESEGEGSAVGEKREK